MHNPVDIPHTPKDRLLGILALASLFLFLVVSIGGNLTGLMNNDACYALLGCNIGFFGYDALVHFVSGMMEVFVFLWLMRAYPVVHILNDAFWKNVFILLIFAAMAGSIWEIGEFAGDFIKTHLYHINIYAPTNRMYQPNNSDTMGDMTFGLLGAFITACATKIFQQKTPRK